VITVVTGATAEVLIGDVNPTVMIGERINPTGRPALSSALTAGCLELLLVEAHKQVAEGAAILDVNVAVPGMDEEAMMVEAVLALQATVSVPLCLDSSNPKVLRAALRVYKGKALVNSVTAEERSLDSVLPMIKEYQAAVIGLTIGDSGIPKTAEDRFELANLIVGRAAEAGIPAEDVVIDCLATAACTTSQAGLTTLEACKKVRDELGVNQTLGGSNISFGVPNRSLVNSAFLPLAISSGVNCPIVDPAHARSVVIAGDFVLGRDPFGARYLSDFRKRRPPRGEEQPSAT
jgi:5-methyltetrahydrofolate--homocysteine methyltransferase